MSRKYKIRDQSKLYFVTFTVIHWLDVFTRQDYRDIFLDSIRYSRHGWCSRESTPPAFVGVERRLVCWLHQQTNEGGFKEDDSVLGNDYAYDDNGNLTKDDNKGVIGIGYNHLNLPSQVTKSGTDYIVYDATGRKLMQQVHGSQAKTTDYIGELVFEDSVLQFITHSEGRVVMDGGVDYQYFLRDHLGNVRVTFSGTTSSDEFKATFEENTFDYEFYAFLNYPDPGSHSDVNTFDHTDAGAAAIHSQLLTGAPGYQIGLAKSFEVNPGDVFDLEVFAKYVSTTGSNTNLDGVLTSLISVFNLPTTGGVGLESADARSAFEGLYGPGTYIGYEEPLESSAPRAFLNYILFDEAFTMIDFGFDQIDTDATIEHDQLSLHVNVQQKGYLYVFLSNENPVMQNVYFDDLKIVRYTDIQQVEDYYPFGLAFNSYSRENSVGQDYNYNGKELQTELDLGWLDYGARMYMPEVGRWGVIDPHAGKYEIITPYNYGFNNPMLFVDPDGRDNVIYLVVAGKFDRKKAQEVANQANKMFAKLGLETRVQLYDDKKNGKFNEKKIENTDNWAVIGTDRKAIASLAKEISNDESMDYKANEFEKNVGNPEKSNNNPNAMGIMIDYSEPVDDKDNNHDEAAALVTIHGAGHSAKLIIDEGGHLKHGVMMDGKKLHSQYRDYGIDHILERNKDSEGWLGNEYYIKAMKERYGTEKKKDNYGKKTKK